MTGARTLGGLGMAWLVVECTRCPRRGRLDVARLVREHGADMSLPDLALCLSADCPRHDAPHYRRCSLRFPDLVRGPAR